MNPGIGLMKRRIEMLLLVLICHFFCIACNPFVLKANVGIHQSGTRSGPDLVQ